MLRWLRTISFFLLLGLCFLPLGSCAEKVERDADGSVRTAYRAIDSLTERELQDAKISHLQIYKSDEELSSGEISGWKGYLILLTLSFLCHRITRFPLIVKPVGMFATGLFALIYVGFSALSMISPTTTIYGWVFMGAGAIYLSSWITALIPGVIFSGREP